jgi:hypothetical protein
VTPVDPRTRSTAPTGSVRTIPGARSVAPSAAAAWATLMASTRKALLKKYIAVREDGTPDEIKPVSYTTTANADPSAQAGHSTSACQ